MTTLKRIEAPIRRVLDYLRLDMQHPRIVLGAIRILTDGLHGSCGHKQFVSDDDCLNA